MRSGDPANGDTTRRRASDGGNEELITVSAAERIASLEAALAVAEERYEMRAGRWLRRAWRWLVVDGVERGPQLSSPEDRLGRGSEASRPVMTCAKESTQHASPGWEAALAQSWADLRTWDRSLADAVQAEGHGTHRLTERERARLDAFLAGTGFLVSGRRVDPAEVVVCRGPVREAAGVGAATQGAIRPGEAPGCPDCRKDGSRWVCSEPRCRNATSSKIIRRNQMTDQQKMTDGAALDQIAAILGLYTTDPANNPVEEVLSDILSYVQETGRATNVPEGA